LGLRWHKIDFDYGESGIITLYRTKNKKERTEFLMPRTKDALLKWKANLEWKRKKRGIANPNSDFIFCRIDGTPLKGFRKSWVRALEIAGIENFHFHDLRHTFGSNLLLSGATLKDVKEMIGHRDLKMTDRYSHLTLAHKHDKQNKLAEHYSQ
jgi:integrase